MGRHKKSVCRKNAMLRLGLAAAAVYVAPVLMQLDQASASGPLSVARDPLTLKECGECHMAFSPRYMRSYSWQKIMRNLENHFGEDASLDDASRKHIEEYLILNGGHPRKVLLRITDTKWFTRTHNREVGQRSRKKAGKMSNCPACHRLKKPPVTGK